MLQGPNHNVLSWLLGVSPKLSLHNEGWGSISGHRSEIVLWSVGIILSESMSLATLVLRAIVGKNVDHAAG